MKRFILYLFLLLAFNQASSQAGLTMRTLLGGKIQILIPKNLSDEYIEQRKSKDKKAVKLTNEDQSVSFSLTCTPISTESLSLDHIKDSALYFIKKFDPSFQLRTSGIKKKDDTSFSFFTYQNSLGTYSYIFFTVKNKELFWFFLSAHKNVKEWEKTFSKMFSSVKIN